MKPPVLQSLRLSGVLSFADDAPPVEFSPLTVFVGANGSGKSNLLDAIALLAAAPRDLEGFFRRNGGVSSWFHRSGGTEVSQASVEATLTGRLGTVRYRLPIKKHSESLHWWEEEITQIADSGENLLYGYFEGALALRDGETGGPRELRVDTIDPRHSILRQRRDPERYPELTALAEGLESWCFYRTWSFGRPGGSVARGPAPVGLSSAWLEEDCSNLLHVLARLKASPERSSFLARLQDVTEGAADFDVLPVGGQLEGRLLENGVGYSLDRVSDGTLRYLALIAILLNPNPPQLVVIDEPEIGLHPHLIPVISDLLRDAAKRTQVIVTTHSDLLVDAFSDTPDLVRAVDREQGKSVVRTLPKSDLEIWLDGYKEGAPALGRAWLRGAIGGTRW